MIYSNISFHTLLVMAYISGVVGENGYDTLFARTDSLSGTNDALSGTNDALSGTNDALSGTNDDFFGNNDVSDTDNIFDDAGARKIKIPVKQPTRRPRGPKPTRGPRLPKPVTVMPHAHPSPIPPPPTGTRTTSPTGICTVPDRVPDRRSSQCSSARNAAYEEALSLFQSRFYDCDCYQVGQFSVSATDELLERKYKADKKGNSRKEALKICARDGVERYINDAAKACIGPSTCQDIGFLVTDLIITDFCAIPSITRYNNDQLKECAREARQVCKGDLFGALIDFLKGGYECPAKDQFGSAAEAREFMEKELSKKCNARVDKLLFD